MSLTQRSQPGPTQSTSVVKPPVNRANPAGVESPARPRRRRASENALRRTNRRRRLSTGSWERAAAFGGGSWARGGRKRRRRRAWRSPESGEDGFEATVHGRKSWWWLRVPGSALSMVRRSDACLHGRSYDGEMAGGEELSGAVENGARERARAREKSEKGEELTAGSERGSASSGRSWWRRIDRRWLGCPRLKTRAKAAKQGFRRSVAR